MRMKVELQGVDEIQKLLGRTAANRLHRRLADDIRDGVDRMTEQAHDNAPILTGALKQSILAHIYKESDFEYVFGSNLPYARRQEYEHKTKGFYFHRAILPEVPKLKSKMIFTIRHTLGG